MPKERFHMHARANKHPNKLRTLLAMAGLNQREAARESGIPEGTMRHYVAGRQVIPRRDRMKLAQVIGCTAQDLAPQYDTQKQDVQEGQEVRSTEPNKLPEHTTLDNCFPFENRKTTAIALNNEETEVYTRTNIRIHYDPQSTVVFNGITSAKERARHEQEEQPSSESRYQQNEESYFLSKIVLRCAPAHERLTLDLWLQPCTRGQRDEDTPEVR